jgi:prophage antirepressor-like protein/Holliday junction resolvase RusA-like endonuclease
MEKLLTFNNDTFEVKVKDNNGLLEFDAEYIAKSLGFVQEKGNKSYIRWERINKYLSDFGFSPFVGKGDFIPEHYVYLLAMKADSQLAMSFQLWLAKDVLPNIRKNGGYINPNATEEQVDKLAKFSLPKLKDTFTNETVEHLMDTYIECREYYKSHNSKERLMMLNRIEKALEDRVNVNKEKMSFPIVCIIDDVIKQIKDDKGKLNNKIRGGQKAQKTRKISKLEPSEDEYMVIDIHGFSANYMYEYVYSSYQDKYIAVASKAYKIWQNKFPACQVTRKEDLNVDWNKPITVFLKFDAVEKIDVQNMQKSILDQVFNRIYQFDDNCISKVVVSRNNTVDTYEQGKIYICIKN